MVQEVEWEGWFMVGVLVVVFVVLMRDWAPPDFTMALAVCVLTLANVITVKDAVAGFANPGVLTVAVLYIVAAALNGTGAVDYYCSKFLGKSKNVVVAQLRLILPVALASGFINDTPLVTMMIPVVHRWVKRNKHPASQFFIPLSFAALLGGTWTLIGTSTNIVVAGIYTKTFGKNLGIFELSVVGIPAMFTGLTYMIIFATRWLPGASEIAKRNNKVATDGAGRSSRDFTLRCVVRGSAPAVGKTIADAYLRSLDGLYLTTVKRGETFFHAVGPEFVIQENDVLYFTGLTTGFDHFCKERGFSMIGYVDAEHGEDQYVLTSRGEVGASFDWKEDETLMTPSENLEEEDTADGENDKFKERIVRVLIRKTSFLCNQTPKEADFRKTFDAAILSVMRRGAQSPIHGNVGRFVLNYGDELLLLLGNKFDWKSPIVCENLKQLPIGGVGGAPRSAPVHGDKIADDWVDLNLERDFLIPMNVLKTSQLLGARSLVGLTVEEAGLRGLPDVFLVAIEKPNGEIVHVAGSDTVLSEGDVLWFVGEREGLGILRRVPGIEYHDQTKKLDADKLNRRLYECVISPQAELIGKTVRESQFRTRYQAAIVAIHRQGQNVISKIGDIVFEHGDVLVLDTTSSFMTNYANDRNFLLVTEIRDTAVPRFDKFLIAIVSVIAMIVLSTTLKISLVILAPVAAAVMMRSGCITTKDARASVNWEVIVTIASAFGLSTALQATGVANLVGQGLVTISELMGTGYFGVIASIYLATFLVSLVVANNAAALLMFPIGVVAASSSCPTSQSSNCLDQVVFTLMLAASSSFATPYGYQTNMMVQSYGHYVFLDYVKFGGPMQIWQWIFSSIIVYYMEYWYVSCALSLVMFITATLLKIRPPSAMCRHDAKTSATTSLINSDNTSPV